MSRTGTARYLLLLPVMVAGVCAAGCVTGGRAGSARLPSPSTASPGDAGSPSGDRAPAPIFAGAAVRVITPDVGAPGTALVRMGGFGPGKYATGVHDDLYARALVIETGGASVALVALDLIGFFHDEVVKIRADLKERGAGVGYVMVASTHTHAGPDVIGLWTPEGGSVDAAYVARVRTAAADAVEEAWKRRRPSRLSFAAVRQPRLVTDSRAPFVVDDLAMLFKADTLDGKDTIATLIDFPDHPESLGRPNTLISSDYPGFARRTMEDAFGGVSIFVSGAVGGLMTPLGVKLDDPATGQPVPEKSLRMAEVIGETLARALVSAWIRRSEATDPGPEFVTQAKLEVARREVKVPLDNARFREGLQAGRIWPRSQDALGALGSEVAAVTLRAPEGGVLAQWACVPGEIYPELVIGGIQEPQDPGADFQGAPPERPLRALMSGRHRFVIGLCNDELGYIIPMSQWDEKPPFAYGRDSMQYGEINSAGPRTAPTLLSAFADLLR